MTFYAIHSCLVFVEIIDGGGDKSSEASDGLSHASVGAIVGVVLLVFIIVIILVIVLMRKYGTQKEVNTEATHWTC